MELRTIGAIPVPLAGIGCNNFARRIDEERSREVVDAAFEADATLFDTADLYGDTHSEEILGRALGPRRDRAVIVSKFGMRTPPEGMTGGDPRWVVRACEESLRRLGTDRIDVYLLHTPDDATPIGDTLTAMSRLVDEGKVREIGCSNFSADQLAEADRVARELGVARFTVLQNHYSLLRRDDDAEVLPLCRELGVSYVPYFPLASGLLTGKYRRDEPAPAGTRLEGREIEEERFDRVEACTAFAEERGHSLHELAICALASTPGVGSIIAGATKPEQVRANVAAASWQLTGDELAALAEI